MIIDYPVPFYSNTPDDLHCYEASLRMILKYFKPQEEYSWEDMEFITGKKEGLWTWPQKGTVWLQKHGFEVVKIGLFDLSRFVADGEKYLQEYYGEAAAQEQVRHSNIASEIKTCKQCMRFFKIEVRLPTWADVATLLQDGYLLGCQLNSTALNGREGYVGHFVVIKGMTDTSVIIHDPGLPPQENREVDFKLFEKAWGYTTEKTKNITAYRLYK